MEVTQQNATSAVILRLCLQCHTRSVTSVTYWSTKMTSELSRCIGVPDVPFRMYSKLEAEHTNEAASGRPRSFVGTQTVYMLSQVKNFVFSKLHSNWFSLYKYPHKLSQLPSGLMFTTEFSTVIH